MENNKNDDENDTERRRKQKNASVIKSLVAGVVEDIKTLPSSTTNSINNSNSTGTTKKNKKNQSRSTNKTNKLRKKRKRFNDGEDDIHLNNNDENQQIHEIQKERYDRLLFTSQKQIYKHVKQVKTFLLQKEIRSNNSKEKETKVSSIKTLDLNIVTQQAIRQLGLYHCDPRYKMITVDENEEEEVNANENRNEKGREEEVDDDDKMEDEEVVDDDNTTLPKKGEEQENKGDDDDKNRQEEENKNSIVVPITIETSEGEEDDDVATATLAEGVTTEEHDDDADTANKESENKQSNNSNRKEYRKKNKSHNHHNNHNSDDDAPTPIPLPLTQDDPHKNVVESILTHKRFSKVLEDWNEKVTEYRRWCMKLEQRNGRMNPFGEDAIVVSSKRSKKNKNKLKNKRKVDSERTDTHDGLTAIVSNESSLFCTLGGGGGDNEGDDGMDESDMMAATGKYDKYGPAGVDGFVPLKKKNRQGQRGRRAKALAIEAKKNGTTKRGANYQQNQYNSTNWREPKIRTENDDRDNTGGGGRKIGSKIGSRGRGKEQKRNNDTSTHNTSTRRQYDTTDTSGGGTSGGRNDTTNSNQPDEQQHPSWAAKQAQSTGIVAFQGKKITF